MRFMGEPVELAITDWAVLALLAEGSTHGFAVARALAPGGEVGQVWTVKRALVYRSIDKLVGLGLASELGVEASMRGPRRTLVEASPAGRRRVTRWLGQPVEHMRDARSLLMLKLLFIQRRAADASPLLRAQRERFMEVERRLEASSFETESDGFARTLALWRLENVRAGLRFVDELLAR
jgi:DNA-binding PadR family transcriptional regulator